MNITNFLLVLTIGKKIICTIITFQPPSSRTNFSGCSMCATKRRPNPHGHELTQLVYSPREQNKAGLQSSAPSLIPICATNGQYSVDNYVLSTQYSDKHLITYNLCDRLLSRNVYEYSKCVI